MIAATFGVVMIHHATIEFPSGREDEARHFYGDILGLREVSIPVSLSEHERGGVWYEASPDGSQQVHLGPVRAFRPQERGHIALFIHHLDALREKFLQAGVRIRPAVPEPGWNRFYAFDPFGNRLEFRAQE